MSEASGQLAPLKWPDLVTEAIRRRKKEKLTQREHAALAGVSVPTIVAFDRGETTLSLAKAFAILRVVGLVSEQSKEGTQDTFVMDAFARWRELIEALPPESPGRFRHGWYRLDYALDGELKDIQLHKLPEILVSAKVRHTGWPMFWVPTRPEAQPREVDGVIECWLAPDSKRTFSDPAHCDFWRAAPTGRMFLMRGYQEDSQETFAPGTIFDLTLPMWRIGEAFLHAASLAKLISREFETTQVRLRVLYTGLMGRDLRAWASPGAIFFGEGGRSKSDEAMLEATAPVSDIDKNLAAYVTPIVSSLFERFGVTGTTSQFVESELDRMRRNRSS